MRTVIHHGLERLDRVVVQHVGPAAWHGLGCTALARARRGHVNCGQRMRCGID